MNISKSSQISSNSNFDPASCKQPLKAVFHLANFITRIDISLYKLTRFLISSNRKHMGQKKKSLRAIKFA